MSALFDIQKTFCVFIPIASILLSINNFITLFLWKHGGFHLLVLQNTKHCAMQENQLVNSATHRTDPDVWTLFNVCKTI